MREALLLQIASRLGSLYRAVWSRQRLKKTVHFERCAGSLHPARSRQSIWQIALEGGSSVGIRWLARSSARYWYFAWKWRSRLLPQNYSDADCTQL